MRLSPLFSRCFSSSQGRRAPRRSLPAGRRWSCRRSSGLPSSPRCSTSTRVFSALSAVARADWAVVEHTAREIRGSFILEQLSAEQLAELHRVLPEAFLALDREFHGHAERLARGAKRADAELAAFYMRLMSREAGACCAPTRARRQASSRSRSGDRNGRHRREAVSSSGTASRCRRAQPREATQRRAPGSQSGTTRRSRNSP